MSCEERQRQIFPLLFWSVDCCCGIPEVTVLPVARCESQRDGHIGCHIGLVLFAVCSEKLERGWKVTISIMEHLKDICMYNKVGSFLHYI